MKITFDTNTLDKAARPERHPKDANQPIFQRVREALKAGTIQGFYLVTMLTTEGIVNADRVKVIAGTRIRTQVGPETTIRNADLPEEVRKMAGERDAVSIPVNFHVEQPDRPPLHRENARRMEAAKAFGVKILKAPPRIAAFKPEDPTGEYFVNDAERGDLSAWIDRIHKAAAAIESHGVGFAQIKALGRQLGVNGSQELWGKALDSAKTDDEKKRFRSLSGNGLMETASPRILPMVSMCSAPAIRVKAILVPLSSILTIASG